MEYDADGECYRYACPCGDEFEITLEELRAGEEIAHCPSCTLVVRVIYDAEEFSVTPENPPSTPPPPTIKALVPRH